MLDDKSNEFITSDLNSLGNDILHENYLKILKFAFPEEAIKEWIKNDTTQYGNYHLDIDWSFPVVQKIESLSTEEVPIDFIIGNGLIQVKVYESIKHPSKYIFLYKNVYATNFEDKTFAIYKGVIAFIDWFNLSIHSEVYGTRPYASPYTIIHGMKRTYEKQFPDIIEIDGLIAAAARAFNTTVNEIKGKTRKQEVVKARQLCMVILFKDNRSLVQAGDIFGKDHATVLHGKKAISNIIDTRDQDYYKPVIEVLAKFDLLDKFINSDHEEAV